MRHILQIHREIIPGPVMDFLVLGRAEAMRIAPEMPHVVISISTPGAEDVQLHDSPNRLDVLRLQFHDIEEPPRTPAAQDEVVFISDDQALSVIRFVQQHRDSVRLIICHCDMGMSRSAGVAAALSKWLQDDDAPFFRHYLPNRYVYEAILKAAQS